MYHHESSSSKATRQGSTKWCSRKSAPRYGARVRSVYQSNPASAPTIESAGANQQSLRQMNTTAGPQQQAPSWQSKIKTSRACACAPPHDPEQRTHLQPGHRARRHHTCATSDLEERPQTRCDRSICSPTWSWLVSSSSAVDPSSSHSSGLHRRNRLGQITRLSTRLRYPLDVPGLGLQLRCSSWSPCPAKQSCTGWLFRLDWSLSSGHHAQARLAFGIQWLTEI